jgi:hypothetical protein
LIGLIDDADNCDITCNVGMGSFVGSTRRRPCPISITDLVLISNFIAIELMAPVSTRDASEFMRRDGIFVLHPSPHRSTRVAVIYSSCTKG